MLDNLVRSPVAVDSLRTIHSTPTTRRDTRKRLRTTQRLLRSLSLSLSSSSSQTYIHRQYVKAEESNRGPARWSLVEERERETKKEHFLLIFWGAKFGLNTKKNQTPSTDGRARFVGEGRYLLAHHRHHLTTCNSPPPPFKIKKNQKRGGTKQMAASMTAEPFSGRKREATEPTFSVFQTQTRHTHLHTHSERQKTKNKTKKTRHTIKGSALCVFCVDSVACPRLPSPMIAPTFTQSLNMEGVGGPVEGSQRGGSGKGSNLIMRKDPATSFLFSLSLSLFISRCASTCDGT